MSVNLDSSDVVVDVDVIVGVNVVGPFSDHFRLELFCALVPWWLIF